MIEGRDATFLYEMEGEGVCPQSESASDDCLGYDVLQLMMFLAELMVGSKLMMLFPQGRVDVMI